ncbi:hypothetical protein LTR84_001664 [Exophiala bonariae]|uniref:t-SNARE coiled-coil homology domain-containing protein n=1 Tax=Exophiala bonariae TaxID=1690606 RepID=A0AAV9NB43_9EURO|nr:hypothetical protein LTR84_001664 [Exophiala bonariae]
MRSAKQHQDVNLLKPRFVKSTRRITEPITKIKHSHPTSESPEPKSLRLVKNRTSRTVDLQSPGSLLADNFIASLDQYRETVSNQATKNIDRVHAELTASLDNLSLDTNHRFEQLTTIDETLSRPFSTETLIIQVVADDDNLRDQEEFSLQTRLTAFRKLQQDKQHVLTHLWDDWEAVQLEIITLTAEVCGSRAVSLSQDQASTMKDGQQEQYDSVLVKGQKLHDQEVIETNVLHKEFSDLEDSISHITGNTNHAVVAIQQKYKVQRSKLFQGLQRHIELLASL